MTVDTRTIYLSVLVLGGIRAGAERIRVRNPVRAAELDAWLKQVTEKHRRRILAMDYEVARLWRWMKGNFNVPVVDGFPRRYGSGTWADPGRAKCQRR